MELNEGERIFKVKFSGTARVRAKTPAEAEMRFLENIGSRELYLFAEVDDVDATCQNK